MDDTRELSSESLTDSPGKLRSEETKKERVSALAHSLTHAGFDSGELAGTALEGILDVLGFERGFIFLADTGSSASGKDKDEASVSLRTIGSRVRRGNSSPSDWVSVRNSEFAVNRAVIKRAIRGRRPVAINDCLLEPTPQGEEQHRAVLCQSFDLTPAAVGVLYLDRELGRGELGEAELQVLDEFASRCLVVVARAFLVGELEKAHALLNAQVQEEGSAESLQQSPEDEVQAVHLEASPSFYGIVGRDEKLQKIFKVVTKIKNSDLNVCIFGESGTGKELLARALHASSTRKDTTFVAENCGAIPENLIESELFGHLKGSFTGADEDKQGLFEVASGGTLFFDEIGDMSEGMQRKLLRVLEEGVIRPIGGKGPIKVDVRVLCASNRDLKVLVEKGRFRADLYYRLNVLTLAIPPLRDRVGDIPALVAHIATQIGEQEGVKKRFSVSAMKALCEYPWPGNIRELTNVLRRVLLTCPRSLIARKDFVGLFSAVNASPRSGENMERDENELSLRIPLRQSFNEIIEECERVVLTNALKQCAWNKSKVTKALKIPRQSLYNKIAKYNLERTWE
jgi:DNA-binding NtrC family response regulator